MAAVRETMARYTMQISEPMTVVTDYVLAGLALWFARRLLVSGSGLGQRSRICLGIAFLLLSLGAFLGGTSHGFAVQLGPAGQTIVWRATLVAIGLTSFFLLATAALAVLAWKWRRVLMAVAAIELLLYCAWVLFMDDDFKWAIYDYGTAMVLTALLFAVAWWRKSSGGSSSAAPWILAGILVSFVAAAVQSSGLSLHRNFNHNDLYHVTQMAALYLLYRGGRLVRDVDESGLVT